jgi:hypothetical protein
VESCVAAAQNDQSAGLIRTGTRVVEGDGTLVYNAPNLVAGLSFTDFVLGWTDGKTGPFLCSTLFRTACLQETGLHSTHNLWNDVIAELRIARRYGRVDVPDVKASYCLHPGELSGRVEIQQWCEDSLELIDTACSLAPDDADALRARLVPFLARINYRHAVRLRKSWSARFSACRFVNSIFGGPPQPRELVMDALKQMAWFNVMRATKRALYP